jgi:hypothetical protein
MNGERARVIAEMAQDLADDDAEAVRAAFCRGVADALTDVGALLAASGTFMDDDRDRGLGLVTQIGGALASGACDLLDSDNVYGAAALSRQIVEVEYLTWVFSDDPSEAARWARVDTRTDQSFRPGPTRKRGEFRLGEYRAHCEMGGHPDPRASHLFAAVRWDTARALRVDLAQHLRAVWAHVVLACAASGHEATAAAHVEHVANLRSAWTERDPRAAKQPLPSDAAF